MARREGLLPRRESLWLGEDRPSRTMNGLATQSLGRGERCLPAGRQGVRGCEEKTQLPSRRFQHIVGAEATPLKHFSDGRIHTEEF